jgi:hypothetical protein
MNSPFATRPVYRAYVVGPDGGILVAHVLDYQTDDEAISRAREYASGNSVEPWNKDRKIAFIPLGGSTCVIF